MCMKRKFCEEENFFTFYLLKWLKLKAKARNQGSRQAGKLPRKNGKKHKKKLDGQFLFKKLSFVRDLHLLVSQSYYMVVISKKKKNFFGK